MLAKAKIIARCRRDIVNKMVRVVPIHLQRFMNGDISTVRARAP